MEIEIDIKKKNPMLNRTEVQFTIKHINEGTPNREIVRGELAGKLNVKKDNIVVDNIHSGFGIQESKGYAKIYSSIKVAKNIDEDYILKRNKLIDQDIKKKETKKSVIEPPSDTHEEVVKSEIESGTGDEKSKDDSQSEEPSNIKINEQVKKDVTVDEKKE